METVYIKYYKIQAGGSAYHEEKFGPLLKASPVFQRGRGIGNVFAALVRFLKPILNTGATFIKNEAINTGVDVLKGIAKQKPLKEIFRDRSVELIDKIRDNTVQKINSMSGGSKNRNFKKKKIIKAGSKRLANHLPLAVKRAKSNKQNKFKNNERILDIFS